ncbi:MAG: D-Ala-D-Ala carboxypeptidase family metallohydrolase [Armatimonadia bacterium]
MLLTDRLTEHWTVDELCKAVDWPMLAVNVEAQDHLRRLCAVALEPIRSLWGAPVECVSGYRSPQRNARIGGATQSQHMFGRAADICPADIDWAALREGRGTEADAKRMREFTAMVEHHLGKELEGIGGIGGYLGWIHVDVRARGENGHIYRWTGRGIGSER